MSESLRVDGQRLRADLDSLAEIGRAPSGGINRTAFSDADAESRPRDHDVSATWHPHVSIDPVRMDAGIRVADTAPIGATLMPTAPPGGSRLA
jgi:hypothetical protein